MTSSAHLDVIVIGAGLSGLRAATELHAAGISYVVLEANDRVGGKTLSVPVNSDGTAFVDMGAAWINDSNQSEMFTLSKEFGFDLVVQKAEGRSLYQDAEGNVKTIPFGLPADLSEEQLAEMQSIIAKFKGYVERTDIENPHLGSDAEELDSLTALEFANKVFGGSLAGLLVTTLTRALLGVEADELSALFLVDYIKSGTGLDNISSDGKDGGQYMRNRQGNERFSTKLCEKLRNGSVKLNSPVVDVIQSDEGCTVKTLDSREYHAKKVIVSIPTSLYSRVNFKPGLPHAKKELGESTELGYFSKIVLLFEEAWWRDADLLGIFTSLDGPISFTRDTSVPEDGQYSITCFMVGQPGRDWSRLSPKDRRDVVLKQFRAASSAAVDRVPEPINIIEKDWSKDHWFQGGPSPVMKPGVMTGAGKAIRDPFQNIHFVGTETSLVWKGYMEGAVRSGTRGAREVLEALNRTSS
ncbi:hypothetical protein NW762_011147 [Fusarium torreyae]|uniref:Amine oxidase n=1 Tax=Fusarium torreyae TaxID=1237075 RepID=A0A9W8VCH0_9HYPO|nr:hypothetical protein NW762_011147 [Fusarium torreyae]